MINQNLYTLMTDFSKQNEKLHIGKLVKNKTKEEGRTVDWLAKNINCHKNNIYRIYRQEHLYPELLLKISLLLQYNFFSHYCEFINEQIAV